MPSSAADPPAGSGHRAAWAAGIALLLLVALALRLWGVRHGMPYAYNQDENTHFVPKAIGLFGHGWNPGYFVNPPLLTYLLHVVLSVGFGGRSGVSETFATDPTQIWVVARITVAVLGTAAVGLLHLAGARLADRRVGLTAAAILAVAFLPVFYGHLALNDAPTLAPLCLSLWGAAGVLRTGRLRDYAIAGIGLGLAAATKYTGGVVLLPLLGAALVHGRAAGAGPALRGVALAAGTALAGFLIGNPFALLDHSAFTAGLDQQSAATTDGLGKLGAPDESGLGYYLWTLTWGLGWLPALAALAGIVVTLVRDRAAALMLVPGPVLFLLFMGTRDRFFGRWLLPIYPMLALLAALAAMAAVTWVVHRRRRPSGRLAPVLTGVAVLALVAQGLVTSVHVDRVLARPDTRALTRDWMVANVPPGSKIVVEPVTPDGWAQDIGRPSRATANGNRWSKFPTSRTTVSIDGGRTPAGKGRFVGVEDYERTLRPALIDAYIAGGYCWVVTGSTQRGRAEADPRAVPGAVAYYRELERRADVAFTASPYAAGEQPVPFSFDWSFNAYPMAYERPGPLMTVYRLRGGRCGR